MSDNNQRHDIDAELTSCDFIRSGPIERGETGTDAERAEFFKRMAFEADKRVKWLEAKVSTLDEVGCRLDCKLQAMMHLVVAADRELDLFQQHAERGAAMMRPQLVTMITNARAALAKAKEGG